MSIHLVTRGRQPLWRVLVAAAIKSTIVILLVYALNLLAFKQSVLPVQYVGMLCGLFIAELISNVVFPTIDAARKQGKRA